MSEEKVDAGFYWIQQPQAKINGEWVDVEEIRQGVRHIRKKDGPSVQIRFFDPYSGEELFPKYEGLVDDNVARFSRRADWAKE